MSEARVIIKTEDALRKFLKFSSASDGSVYMTLGYRPMLARSFGGELAISAGAQTGSVDYTAAEHRTDFHDAANHHIGFKGTGIGLVKAGTEYGRALKMSRLSELSVPTIIAAIYPCPLERFDKIDVSRASEIVIPDNAGSPQNLSCATLDKRFGDGPFYAEVWACPADSSLPINDPGTVGFYVSLSLDPYAVGLVFRQDTVVMRKGWPEATQVLMPGDTGP